MNAFSSAARIGVMDKQSAPNRFKHVHQGVLNHSVGIEWQFIDDPLLGFIDHLFNIGRRGKGLLNQCIPNIEYVLVQVVIEAADGVLPTLALSGLLVGKIDVIYISYILEKISMSLHMVFEKSNVLFRY